jgi:AraC family transcriptional regulator
MADSVSLPTFDQWFETPTVQVERSSAPLGWQGVTVHTARLFPPRVYNVGPESHDDTLAVVLSGSTRINARVLAGNIRTFSAVLVPGSIDLIPRDYHFESMWDQEVSAIFITYSRSLVAALSDSVLRGDPAGHSLQLSINFHDPLLFQLSLALRDELVNGGLNTLLYVESVLHTMILRLLRLHASGSPVQQRASGRLSPGQQRIIDEYVEAHLHQDIRVETLAQLLHLSIAHFERIFRATYGIPPYRFVILRRVERAKMLLTDSRLTLYDVGHLCGFASQSHFTRHFKKITGITPGEYARRCW